MKFIAKGATPVDLVTPAPETSDFEIDKLLQHCQTVLIREVKNLMSESSKGKLSASSSRDLVVYLELLQGMQRKMVKSLAELSDEDLAKLLKK